ncbi:OST-HTH/LOTUS domain-containing protein [Ruegeria atlantica]|uniref:OST-HTH/LOTUS domain protein n=1 Tax=Ruegeria atlantica TaxID=81569 RepID=A0A0P1EAC7_9RHOB|nr:OST-HTH/LOTUS domain-containing protein [Ruegeria atlantica]CUH45454.1 OST-HTH/LOTUS domain protein [Ruegeria atlantica]
MTKKSDNALHAVQLEIERLLGRCLLQLQQYERLLKIIVAHHEISASTDAGGVVNVERKADTSVKTLGSLVTNLFGSYIVTNEIETSVETALSRPEATTSFGMRMHLKLSDADFAQTEKELRELVQLRNNLVHHFIDEHDLGSEEGCRSAQNALVAAYNRIDWHLEQLRGWDENMDQSRRAMAEFIQTDVFHDLVVNGIAPDGTVFWPAAGVVSCLREAARELAVDGWAPVVDAGRRIAEQYPDQLPAKYGCSSWRQVVHESRIFELRYREVDGKRAAWYRGKDNS